METNELQKAQTQGVALRDATAMIKLYESVHNALSVTAEDTTPSLAAINRDAPECLRAVIAYSLAKFCRYIGVDFTLTEADIRELTDDIITRFYYFSVQDVKQAFDRAKTREFYNKLSPAKILQIFEAYDEIRTAAWAEYREREAEQYKER